MSGEFFLQRQAARQRIAHADDIVDTADKEYRQYVADIEPIEATDEHRRLGGSTAEVTVNVLWLADVIQYYKERAENAERDV